MQASFTARPTGMELAGKAFGSAAEAWTKMKLLVISAGLASAVLAAILALVVIGSGGTAQVAASGAWVAILKGPLQAAIDAPLAVAIHRLILKGEVTAGIITLNRPYQWRFFWWLCAIAFVGSVLTGLVVAIKPLVLLLALGMFFFFIKSVLIFPAIAVEAPVDNWRDLLRTSWRQMDGNFWLFFRAFLLMLVPLIFAVVVISMGLGLVGGLIVVITQVGVGIFLVAIQMLISGIVQPLAVMFVAALASWLYLWVTENPAAQAQSAQTATSTVT